jgi:DNA-binding MarR family transcriptional regulator
MANGKAELLEGIADNLLMVLPLAYKRMMRVGKSPSGKRASFLETPLLSMLERNGPMPTCEMGRRLCISKPNMTPLIKKLISEGKAKRLPGSGDRRIHMVAITSAGRMHMRDHSRAVKKDIKRNLSSLGAEDLTSLSGSLETIRCIIARMEE